VKPIVENKQNILRTQLIKTMTGCRELHLGVKSLYPSIATKRFYKKYFCLIEDLKDPAYKPTN